MNYEDMFYRNYGLFSRHQQDRIRRSSILIIGCGGIGGTVAIILARTGFSNFTIVEPDSYEPTNMNRQIGCYTDTVGKNKAEVIKNDIIRINASASVKIYPELLPLEKIGELVRENDIVFPAADDFAYSVMSFRLAADCKKTALMVVPAGMWAMVSVITPDSPTVEELHGIPRLGTYQEMKKIFSEKRFKMASYFYTFLGGWRKDYFTGFIEEGYPPAQICPLVWLSSSLGAMEVIKFITASGNCTVSPYYWLISKRGIKKERLGWFSIYNMLVLQRKIMWRVYNSPLGKIQEKIQMLWWERFFCDVEKRGEKVSHGEFGKFPQTGAKVIRGYRSNL